MEYTVTASIGRGRNPPQTVALIESAFGRTTAAMESSMFDWNNIDVLREDVKEKTFAVQSLIGQRERLLSLIDLIGNNLDGNSISAMKDVISAIRETKSQFLQELFALTLTRGKRGGFFVEFGACDGMHLSNTYLLEKKFGWGGILAEPARAWHDKLAFNRPSAKIDRRYVSGTMGEHVDFSEGKEPDESRISDSISSDPEKSSRYTVETVSLLGLLRFHGAPKYIDYLSIDTEGSEFSILQSFDFTAHQFGFISIEQHDDNPMSNDVTSILARAGYRPLFKREQNVPTWSQITGFDTCYVPHA